MFGLEKRHISFIIETLNKNIKDETAKYYVFGSRAKGNFKEYSDIDIAIDLGNKKLSTDILSKILIEFEDSTFPYEVDIIDLKSITPEFKAIISDSLIEISQ